jgi:hypothetical protein
MQFYLTDHGNADKKCADGVDKQGMQVKSNGEMKAVKYQ